jgi:hypothetical protein
MRWRIMHREPAAAHRLTSQPPDMRSHESDFRHAQVTEVDAGTRVDITADNVPDGIAAKDHAAGLASSLMNLAEYLKGSWKT